MTAVTLEERRETVGQCFTLFEMVYWCLQCFDAVWLGGMPVKKLEW